MTKKKIYTMIALLIVLLTVVILYWKWTKPYELPNVKEGLTLSEVHLDLTVEHKLVHVPIENPETDRSLPKEPGQVNKSNAPLAYYYALHLIETSHANSKLAIQYLTAAVKADPDNLAYSNKLRLIMRDNSQSETFIQLMKQFTNNPKTMLQEALAYVDLLQNPDLGTASLGQKSAQSITILNQLIEQYPENFLAHYARGLNNLYWPKGLQRTEKAIQDLAYCLAVEQKLEQENLPLWPLIYIAYGDALVKNGKVRSGILVWKEGKNKYPDNPSLLERSGANEKTASEIVRRERGIDGFTRPNPDVSDISVIWN